MDILIEITYAALVFAAFKIFKVPVNKWTITTSVVGGIFVVGFIFLAMAYYHPYTPEGKIYFQTTPIMPQVRGKVLTVKARNNEPLKKGDVLFEIDPTPFKADFERAKSALSQAQAKVSELEKTIASAKAEVDRSNAATRLAEVTEQRMRKLWDTRVIAKQEYDESLAHLRESQAKLNKAKADERQALASIDTQLEAVHEAEAALNKAQFNLESTTVRAPTDGHVIQVRLRPGMMAVPLPLKPVMTFVSADGSYIVGEFKQNPLQNIKVGNRAEVIFPALPGRAFRGRVTKIMSALGEGQLMPDAELMRFEGDDKAGRVPVFIKLDEEMTEYTLPVGIAVAVAVYGEDMEFLAPIRQILLRMVSWRNIVCLEAF